MKYYDVVIVGAGPGGLACAKVLGNSNLSVLLIEKDNFLGNKKCAGGLSWLYSDFIFNLVNNGKENVNIYNYWYIIQGNEKRKYKLKYPMVTVYRKDLGNFQLNMLKNYNNVDVVFGEKVLKIYKDRIITKKRSIGYKFLIGADGSNSIVRQYLGLPVKYNVGIYYEISKVNNNVIWDITYFKKGYYLRVFPHKFHENIGIFYNPSILTIDKAKEILYNFIKNHGYGSIVENKKVQGYVVNYYYLGYIFKNIFLVGDAAGFAFRTTGEGILPAIISGEEVGNFILNNFCALNGIKKLLNWKYNEEKYNLFFNLFFCNKK